MKHPGQCRGSGGSPASKDKAEGSQRLPASCRPPPPWLRRRKDTWAAQGPQGAQGQPAGSLRREGRETAVSQAKSRQTPPRFSKACPGDVTATAPLGLPRAQTPSRAGAEEELGGSGAGMDLHRLRASLLTRLCCPQPSQMQLAAGSPTCFSPQANMITSRHGSSFPHPFAK